MTLSCPRIVYQSIVYEPEGHAYRYRINFDENYGYTVMRRLAPDNDQPNFSFWNRSVEVENYVQLEKFYPSYAALPVKKFSTIEEAQAIIIADMKAFETA